MDNLRVKFIFPADSARRSDLLLYDVALPVTGVADGDLFNELARSRRIFTRNDRFADSDDNFPADWSFFVANLQNSPRNLRKNYLRQKKILRGNNFANREPCRTNLLCSADFNGWIVENRHRLRRTNSILL